MPQSATGLPADELHPFERTLARLWPRRVWADANILVAVSGGPDSVALLRALTRLKPPARGRLEAAHVNHGLRPGDCDRDEALVRELCGKLTVPCHVRHVPPKATDSGRNDGREGSARRARYRELADLAREMPARFLLTAHTADDQAETILHRILRGTGIQGLGGIARRSRFGPHSILLRPLLSVRRQHLREYLDDIGQHYRLDLSNHDLSFTRNAIRHELLPLLASRFNRKVSEALIRLGKLAQENTQAIDSLVVRLARQVVEQASDGSVAIDVKKLGRFDAYLKRELIRSVWSAQRWPLQKMGHNQWKRLESLIDSPAPRGRLELPGKIVATFDGRILALRRTQRH